MAAALVLAVARLATLLPGYQSQFTSLLDQATGRLGEFGVTQQQLDTAVRGSTSTAWPGSCSRC